MRNESACFLTISTNRYTCNKHALSPSDEWPGLGRERENVERGEGGEMEEGRRDNHISTLSQ